MKKKYAIGLMLMVQIIILTGLFVWLITAKNEQYVYKSSELVYIEDDGEGQVILSPYLTLKPGSYTAEIFYHLYGETGEASLVTYGKRSEDVLTNSRMAIYEGSHTLQSEFYCRWWLDGFSVRIQTEPGAEIEVESIVITDSNACLKQMLVILFIIFALMDCVYVVWRELFKGCRKCKEIMFGYDAKVIVITALVASLPLGMHYLLNGQDLEFHLLRIEGLCEALCSGQFPSRMHPTYMEGYGYPTGIFYPELFLYPMAFLRMLGMPLMHTYKIFLLVQNVATAAVAWYSGKILFRNDKSARVFCVLYTLAPYRLMNEYYRAALGESMAMTFLPLIIAGLYLLLVEEEGVKERLRKGMLLLVIGMTGVLQSHILSCGLYGIFIVLAIIFYGKRFLRNKVWLAFLASIGMTILLNLWFLVPFVFAAGLEVKVLLLIPGILTQQGLNVWQLLSFLPDASGHSMSLQEGISAEMPFQLGWAIVILFAVSFCKISTLWQRRKNTREGFGLFSLAAGLLSAWMTTYLFPWDMVGRIPKLGKIINTIQFPWRFMGIATIFLLIAGVIAVQICENEKHKNKLMIVAVAVSLVTALWFFQSTIRNADYYTVYDGAGLNSYALVGEEYLYQGTDLEMLKKESNREAWYVQEGTNVICTVADDDGVQDYRLPLLYYPWYVAKDVETGEKMNIIKGENNVAFLDVPEEYSGTIEVSFEEPVAWKLGNIVSLCSFIGLFAFWYSGRRKKLPTNEEN